VIVEFLNSVAEGYLVYSQYRAVQHFASAVLHVLSTQVGLLLRIVELLVSKDGRKFFPWYIMCILLSWGTVKKLLARRGFSTGWSVIVVAKL